VKSDRCSILNARISRTDAGNHGSAFNAMIAAKKIRQVILVGRVEAALAPLEIEFLQHVADVGVGACATPRG
jgi:hypothetical protein